MIRAKKFSGAVMAAGLVLFEGIPAFAGPATQPATQPALAAAPSTQPATQPAVAMAPATRPSADSVLSNMDAAYAKITSAAFDGHITGNFDVEGQQTNDDVPFTSSFSAPNQFRHDAPGDVLLGSTGTRAFAYLAHRDEYQSADAAKGRVASKDLPLFVTPILAQQNPSLLLAMSKSASAELKEISKKITLEKPTVIDGVSYDTLRFDAAADGQVITMLVDPATHLLRRVHVDLRKSLEKAGSLDVKQAEMTVDYTRTVLDGGVSADQFAWSAPAGAVLTTATVAMADSGDGLGGDVKALIGKAAPDFTLKGLDDQPMKLSDQKGSVVVLDFWATWCGPCVASLPHLNSLYKEQQPNGLKVFALDQSEENEKVAAFVKQKGWVLPILLDSNASVAAKYKVTGIPQTVIIGKDGTVKQIYIGSGHETEIAARVAKEMQ